MSMRNNAAGTLLAQWAWSLGAPLPRRAVRTCPVHACAQCLSTLNGMQHNQSCVISVITSVDVDLCSAHAAIATDFADCYT